MTKINYEELKIVEKQLEMGNALTLTMIGRIFGEEFWQLIIYSMIGMTIKADNIQIKIGQENTEVPPIG